MNEKEKAVEAAAYIQEHFRETPRIGFLIGTGLGDTAGIIETPIVLDYGEIPHFPVSTVQSHRGKLVLGKAFEKPVMALQGRFHLYEGYSPQQVSFPVRVMQELGVGVLILSNAAGGINPEFNAGDIMVIRDHINLTGENPLVGPNEDAWGERFPDMINAYDKTLADMAIEGGRLHVAPMRKGVYVGLKGPSLETPAEVKFLRTIGAEAVGFSTVQEVIAAVHAGMKVLGLSVITNVLTPDNPVPARVDDIIEKAGRTSPAVEKIIAYVFKHLQI